MSHSVEPPFHLGYRPWLDGLRGVAILAVLGYHLDLLKGGFLGVDLFFVVSGFLITALLMEEWHKKHSLRLKQFYLRRALRLWPAFFALLLVCGLVSYLVLPADAGFALRKEILVSGCYLTDWPLLHGVKTPTLGHTWSLSIEEQFYLIWPFLLYAMLRFGLGRGTIIVVVCLGIIASAWFRTVLHQQHPAMDQTRAVLLGRIYMGLDTRADSLLAGCLAGLIVGWGLLPTSRRFQFGLSLMALISAGVLLHLFQHSHPSQHQLFRGLFTGVALMVAVILIRLVSAPCRLAMAILEFKPLVGVGRVSYALYLFHMPIIRALQPQGLGWNYPLETLLVLGLSFSAAIASWYCIEAPCLRLKKRLAEKHSESQIVDDEKARRVNGAKLAA